LNHFILKRDSADHFHFASLQGSLAHDLLHRYNRDANDLDTVYVFADFGEKTERLLSKGRAVIHVLRSLGGVWSAARVLEVLPAKLVDALYAFVARHRYGWFGRYETCLLPRPKRGERGQPRDGRLELADMRASSAAVERTARGSTFMVRIVSPRGAAAA
jgi:predicted DCC family thiol-disulfide oxidoreductase YuxK